MTDEDENIGKARKDDKDTSKEAAKRNQRLRKIHQTRILSLYAAEGEMTYVELGELAQSFTGDHRVRSKELERKGWVANTGRKKYHSSHPSTIWTITQAGRDRLGELNG